MATATYAKKAKEFKLTAEQSSWLDRSNDVVSLHEAAWAGDLELVKLRISQKAPVNQVDERGYTPLHLAAASGKNPKIIQALLKAGADVTLKDRRGRTAEQVLKNKKALTYFKEANAVRDRELMLIAAIDSNNKESAQKLLSEGVSPNSYAKDGITPALMYAIEKKRPLIIKALIQSGANPNCKNANGYSALHIAAGHGDRDTLKVMLESGADPMARTPHGAYPIHETVWFYRNDLIDLILPYYKNVNFNPHGAGNGYPIYMALSRGSGMVLPFIKAGFNPNDDRMKDNPILIEAVKNNDKTVVAALIKAGANKNAADKDGKKAIDYARSEEIKALLH